MNYTLKELQEQVNRLIERQGEDAHCAAWIYTKQDVCFITDGGDETYPCEGNPELTERIFYELGDVDYIYTVIQDILNDITNVEVNQGKITL